MEPRQVEQTVEPRDEARNSLPRQPERKRRFQIIKLEERIAPAGAGNHTLKCQTHGHNCTGLGCT